MLYAEMLKLPITPIKYLAPKIWEFVPDQIKHCGSLSKFKHFIKSWSSSDCPCRLCKKNVTQVGFISLDITMELGDRLLQWKIFV